MSNPFRNLLIEHIIGSRPGKTIEEVIDSGEAEAYETAFTALLKGDITGFIAALPADLQAKLLAYAATQAGTVLPSPPAS